MRVPLTIAALVAVSSLPAADVAEEARAILARSCYRCHGPERQKSGYRLDRRGDALRGGDFGTAIVPGKPEASPLLRYVRHAEPDMEMPPIGKGDRLTDDEVATLERWITAGADWRTNSPVRVRYDFTPMIRSVWIDGNRARYEEHSGNVRGPAGGVSQFSLTGQLDDDTRIAAEGRAIFGQEDYRVGITLERQDIGFLRFGAERWTRFYDNHGGFQPGVAAPAPLGRDLELNLGRTWVELGLTPPTGPAITLGYEYAYRDGAKSMLTWGLSGGVGIGPAFKAINDDVHTLRLDLQHDWRGTEIQNEALFQIHSLDTSHTFGGDTLNGTANPSTGRQRTETHTGANTLRLARQIRDWWYGEAAYHYSRLRADAALNVTTTTAAGALGTGPQWSANNLLNEAETHAFSLSSLIGPFADLTLSPSFQTEWNRRRSAGSADLAYIAFGPLTSVPVVLRSSRDEHLTTESVNLRYNGIPTLVLAGEVRLQQSEQGIFEQQLGGDAGFDPLVTKNPSYLQRTDGDGARQNYEVSLRWSPGTRWAWTSKIRHHTEETGYLNQQSTITPVAAAGGAVVAAYPGIIRSWAQETDEWSNRLTLHLRRGWRSELTYRVQRMEHVVVTSAPPAAPAGGGEQLASTSDAHTVSFGNNLALHPRWNLNLNGSFTDSSTVSAANGIAAVAPWNGRSYSAAGQMTFIWNPLTEIHGAYSLSLAEFGQTATAGRVVAGTDYALHSATVGIRRRLRTAILNLRYGLDRYNEPTSGNLNNYTAHTLFAALTLPWPGSIPTPAPDTPAD